MVTVRLGGLHLNDATNPSDGLVLQMLAGSAETWPTTASVRTYAGGRLRAARGPRAGRTWTPTLAPVPLATARWLQERAGAVHWARDLLGGKVACLWVDAPATWLGPIGDAGEHLANVTMTLLQVTHDEVPT